MAYRLEELKNVKILKRDLNEVLRYTHLEIKNNTIDENRISHEEIDSIFVSLRVAKSLSLRSNRKFQVNFTKNESGKFVAP